MTNQKLTTKYNEFLTWVDIKKLSTTCHGISQQTVLNESTNRMMKEKFILGAVMLANHKKNITWTDARDYDVVFTDWEDGQIEVKTGNEPLFSTKTGKPKKRISIKLKNVYESRYQRTTLDKEFDHLMIVQIKGKFAVSFVDYATVKNNLKMLTDGFLVQLTHDQIYTVYEEDMRDSGIPWTLDLDPKTWVLDQLAIAMR